MRLRVPIEILQRYYELWLEGKTSTQIIKSLKLSRKKFDEYTPDFLTYCRHQVKYDVRARLTDGNPPDLVELTPERADEFIGYVSTGLSYDKAALMMNVPLITVTDYWFKDLVFKERVKMAVELINARAIQAFYKRVVGYEYVSISENVVNTSRRAQVGVDGETPGTDVMRSVTTTNKVVLPDVNAGKFWLYNRIPDQFSVDGQRTNVNNKGKILKWIDEQAEISEDNLKKYDDEQDEYDDEYFT